MTLKSGIINHRLFPIRSLKDPWWSTLNWICFYHSLSGFRSYVCLSVCTLFIRDVSIALCRWYLGYDNTFSLSADILTLHADNETFQLCWYFNIICWNFSIICWYFLITCLHFIIICWSLTFYADTSLFLTR